MIINRDRSSILKNSNVDQIDTISDKDRDKLNKALKIVPRLASHNDNKLIMTGLIDECTNLGIKVIQDLPHSSFSYYDPKKKEIHISKNPIAIIVAHEVGHAISWTDTKGISKWSSKLYGPSKLINAIVTLLYPTIGSNIAYDMNYEKNKIAKYAILNFIALLLPFLTFSPVLAQEKVASNYAVDLCKKYGASDEYITLGKACLKAAYFTYIRLPLVSSIFNMILSSSSAFYKDTMQDSVNRMRSQYNK